MVEGLIASPLSQWAGGASRKATRGAGAGVTPADQIRSKLRASSQSVTTEFAFAHSWRAVLTRC